VLPLLVLLLLPCVSILAADRDRDRRDEAAERRLRIELRQSLLDYQSQLARAEARRRDAHEQLIAADRAYELAYKALLAARKQHADARRAETQIIVDLKKLTEVDPRRTRAREALDEANARESAARERIIAALRDRNDYRDALYALDRAKAGLETVKKSAATPADLQRAAQNVIDKDQVVGAIREKALDADPDYQQAHADVLAATRQLAAVDRALDEQMRNDPGRLRRNAATLQAAETVKSLTRDTAAARREVARHKAAFNQADADVRGIERAILVTASRLRQLGG